MRDGERTEEEEWFNVREQSRREGGCCWKETKDRVENSKKCNEARADVCRQTQACYSSQFFSWLLFSFKVTGKDVSQNRLNAEAGKSSLMLLSVVSSDAIKRARSLHAGSASCFPRQSSSYKRNRVSLALRSNIALESVRRNQPKTASTMFLN